MSASGSLAAAVAVRPVVLDGGLATRLEARGHDLSDDLWSARLLVDQPGEVVAAHADFFAAGAQVATTASYQVSFDGFAAHGVDAAEHAAAAAPQRRAGAEAARGRRRTGPLGRRVGRSVRRRRSPEARSTAVTTAGR